MEPISTYSINPEVDASSEGEGIHIDVNGTQVSYVRYPATSYSSSSATFSIIPPSVDTFVNRCIRKNYPIRVTYTGTTSGSLLLDSGYDALRSLPTLRMTLSEIISFNGSSFPSTQVFDLYPDILEHYDHATRKYDPLSAPDMSSVLQDCVGSVNNPLASYNVSESYEGGIKRGAYTITAITRGATSCVIDYNVIGYLYLPKLLGLDCVDQTGLIRMRQINVTSNFDMTSAKIISHAAGGLTAGTLSAVCTMYSQPELVCKFISVPSEMIPRGPLRYPNFRMERFVTSYGSAVGAGASATIVSNNIQLQRIPRYIFAFVRESDAYKTIGSSDTFATINAGMNINFNNQSGLLSSASNNDLWLMSKACGLLDSFPQFNGSSVGADFTKIGSMGSLLCLEFGKHISLGSGDLAIGSVGSFNFNMTIPFTNPNLAAQMTSPTLYLITVYDQIMIVGEAGEVLFELPVTPVGAIASGMEPVKVPWGANSFGGGEGAGFMDWMKKANSWLKSSKLISSVASSVAPALGQFGPVASAVGSVARNMGYGGPVGGAFMTSKQLKQRLQSL